MDSLATIARTVDKLNDSIGRHVSWLALGMVLMQFLVVMLRYVFGYGSIAMQESIIYMHGTLFLVGAGYTLFHGGHVRVDIFYSGASYRKKALIDMLGCIFLLFPVFLVIGYVSFPYVANSWAVLEGSKETSGIQGISMVLHSILILTGHEKPAPEEAHQGV